jgi:hypothetical protein
MELVSQPDTSIVYVARRSELRLTLKSRYPLRNPITGQPEGTTRGIFAGFRDGTLRIPREGKVVLVDTLDGGESEEIDASGTLEAVLEQERAGWGREDLIAAAQRQVERIRAMEAERDAQVAAAREEADQARVKAEAEAKEAREALAKATKGAKS